MPITRNGPVMNLDTDQKLQLVPNNQRLTRTQLSRILKHRKVDHDPGAPLETLWSIMSMNNIQLTVQPPGPLHDENGAPLGFVPAEPKKFNPKVVDGFNPDDGYPSHIGKVKRMCGERGITYPRTAKRKDLVKLLNEQRH